MDKEEMALFVRIFGNNMKKKGFGGGSSRRISASNRKE